MVRRMVMDLLQCWLGLTLLIAFIFHYSLLLLVIEFLLHHILSVECSPLLLSTFISPFCDTSPHTTILPTSGWKDSRTDNGISWQLTIT
jgi:hypothetical protein